MQSTNGVEDDIEYVLFNTRSVLLFDIFSEQMIVNNVVMQEVKLCFRLLCIRFSIAQNVCTFEKSHETQAYIWYSYAYMQSKQNASELFK